MKRHLAGAALLLLATNVRAATHTWSGPMVGGFWSNPMNWMGGPPTSNEAGGTIVVFLSGVLSIHDMVGLTINEIHFIGGGNVVAGSTTLSFGSAPSPDLANVKSEGGGNTFAPTLPLSAPSGLQVTVVSGTVTIGGTISGNAPILQAASSGTLVFSGANAFTGIVNIGQGTLALSSSTPNTAIPNGVSDHVFVGDFMGAADSAVLRNLLDEQIVDYAEVVTGPDGRYDLNDRNETIRDVATFFPGGSVALGSGTLTLKTLSGVLAQYDGTISGTGNIVKTDAGLQVFTGTNSYTGTTTVSDGTLMIKGSQPGSAVTVTGAGILLGSGTIGPLTLESGGLVSPGGNMSYQYGSTGILNVAGATNLAAGVYRPDLDGTTAGTSYDQLSVTGDVSIGGATLDPYLTFTPSAGTMLTVLTCTG
ncbi:MAG TPA: autotransporter-associated beta strand repeat-containing protein, partial [Thermoanaerobaculia bacterium]|nr:autotransporter-associated beta strand repeat-containing protein [Thermoanaerobaculia bacterium]